jgi:phytoene desaturase
MKGRVVIIGAGIGGLATANLFAKAGYEVEVFEKNDQLGGRAGEKQVDGFRFDTGPSWYLMPAVFEQYFALFGVNARKEFDLKRLSPAYKVFYESRKPITIAGDVSKDSATFESIEPGAGDALQSYVEQGDHTYQLALEHFLYTNFERPQELTHPAVISHLPRLRRLLLTPIHRHVRSFMKTQALQQILEYPMVFLGSSPFTAPAMYSLMSALDFKEGVYYPRKSMYQIIRSLQRIGEELGVRYHLNSPVEAIVTEAASATGIRLKNGRIVTADIVISNADLHYTETRLLKPGEQTFPETYWKKKEAGISALLIYLGVKGTLPHLEHHNLFFVDDWRENFEAIYTTKHIPESASMYVSRTTATDPTTAPKNHENLFVLVPLPSGVKIDKRSLQRLTRRTIDQLATVLEIPDLTSRIVYQESFGPNQFESQFHAWQGTALGTSHRLTQSAFWRTPNKSKKLKNLYYVGGNTVPGIGLPMCLIGAQLVFKRVIGNRRGGAVQPEELA